MARRLVGKVALVTGGSSGIGRASALAFAREGARVVVKEAGGEALFIKTDMAKAAEIEAIVYMAVKASGRLDCAHNNAGIEGALATTAGCPEENWDRVISINLKGVWLCMKYEIPQMLIAVFN